MTVDRWTDERLDELAESVDKLVESIKELRDESKDYREELKEQTVRFTYYQQASQWVENLAFSLILSATVITIISAIFPR